MEFLRNLFPGSEPKEPQPDKKEDVNRSAERLIEELATKGVETNSPVVDRGGQNETKNPKRSYAGWDTREDKAA